MHRHSSSIPLALFGPRRKDPQSQAMTLKARQDDNTCDKGSPLVEWSPARVYISARGAGLAGKIKGSLDY
jgi:hypothetical protein